jgi:hypothetical protein
MSEKATEVPDLIRALMEYIPETVIDCHGSKCRQLWCAACYDEETNARAMTEAMAVRDNAQQVLAGLEAGLIPPTRTP